MRGRVVVSVLVVAGFVAGCSASDGGDTERAPTTSVGLTTTASATTSSVDVGHGAAWSSVDDPGTFGGPGEQEMRGVAFSDGIWVAVGLAQGADAVDVGRADAAVWVSPDGIGWTRVGDDSVFDEVGSQSMQAVTSTGAGFVAVGAAERTHQDDPAVWLSDDGHAWRRVEDSTGAFQTGTFAQMWDVVIGGPGLVAVGFAGAIDTFDAAVWVSRDGTVWDRVIDDAIAGEGNEFITAVVALGDGRLVAVGQEERDGRSTPAVWISTDGLSWERSGVSTDDQGVMLDVAVWDHGLVAVGRDASGDDIDAAVWMSDDGDDWIRVEDPSLSGPGDQVLAGVAANGTEITAVGYERITDRNAAIWRSTDAEIWTRSAEETTTIEGFQELFAVAVSDTTTVAVGYSGEIGEWDAAVWHRAR